MEIKNIMTKEDIIKAIEEYFKENEDVFNDCIESLDSYNGYLGDDRYYSMDELDELYSGESATEILQRAFYGYDEDTSTEESYTKFNPNCDYFRFNGYGNLVSTNYKDYSAQLDHWTIESMAENRSYIDPIDEDETLSRLFDEYEEMEDC